jgi:hypothetical protein
MNIVNRLDTAQQNQLKQHLQQFHSDIRKVDAVNLDTPLLENISRRPARPKAARVFTQTVLMPRSKCTDRSLAPIQGLDKKRRQD